MRWWLRRVSQIHQAKGTFVRHASAVSLILMDFWFKRTCDLLLFRPENTFAGMNSRETTSSPSPQLWQTVSISLIISSTWHQAGNEKRRRRWATTFANSAEALETQLLHTLCDLVPYDIQRATPSWMHFWEMHHGKSSHDYGIVRW